MQLEQLEAREVPAVVLPGSDLPGALPRPEIVAEFGGHVQYLVADLNGDLLGEEVYVGDEGAANRVLVLDGDPTHKVDGFPATLLNSFLQGESALRSGLSVAVLHDAGQPDSLALSFHEGGGSQVVKLSLAGGVLSQRAAFAFDAEFRGGVRLTTGDVNRDGADDILAIPDDGGGPVAVILDGRTLAPLSRFLFADPSLRLVAGNEFALPPGGAIATIQGPGLVPTVGIVIDFPARDTDARVEFLSPGAFAYFLPDGTNVTALVAGFDPIGVDPLDL